MEQRNEPSTDIEITLKKPKNDELLVKGGGSGREPINTECAVRALNTIAEVSPQWSGAIRFAADRLEQLERENAELRGKIDLQSRICKVCEQKLTARAEQAEQERDAAVNALTLYEDALFDECDKSYQSGFMDGFRSREGIDDED